MRRYNVQTLEQLEHGGFWIRVLATLVDTAVLLIPIAALEVSGAGGDRVLEGRRIVAIGVATGLDP